MKRFTCDIEEVVREGRKVPYDDRWRTEVTISAPDRDVAEATLDRLCEGRRLAWFNLEEKECHIKQDS